MANVLLDFIENVDPNFTNQNYDSLISFCFKVYFFKFYKILSFLKILEESAKIDLQKKIVMVLASVLDIHYQIEKDLSGKESSRLSLIKMKKKKSSSTNDPNEIKTKDKISEILNYISLAVLKC